MIIQSNSISPPFPLSVRFQVADSSFSGYFETHLVCSLKESQGQISCPLTFLLTNNPVEALSAQSPYAPRPKVVTPKHPVVPGVPVQPIGAPPKLVKLPFHPIPKALKEQLEKASDDDLESYLRRFQHSFTAFLHQLLWLEELAAVEAMENYSMENQLLQVRSRQMFFVEVPGLAEKRPSVLLGDGVLIYCPAVDSTRTFEGVVHEVLQAGVEVRCSSAFHSSYKLGMPVSIRFTFNRTPMRRCHEALEQLRRQNSIPLLMARPAVKKGYRPTPLGRVSPLSLFDSELNVEQELAVNIFLQYSPQQLPLILFGPPGTGKTSTLIEIIRQSLRLSRTILVAAPSNSAADLFVERLSDKLAPHQMLRLNAAGRDFDKLAPLLRKYSRKTPPCLEELARFQVIISTFSSVALLVGIGIPSNHFSTLILDEVGQAHVPEALIALAPYFSTRNRAILAGDPCQLGPIIQHRLAARLGLKNSLLDLLMEEFPAYSKQALPSGKVNHGYDPQCVIKLVRNYRSHDFLIQLPSKLFYENELISCAPETITQRYVGWSQLPNRKIPFIFRGLNSQHQREGSNPSFFNPIECVEVRSYVHRLLSDEIYRTAPSDIGVITPYQGQVRRIRMVLNNPAIKVGTVEEFQGQEKPVIIISAVRSSSDWQDVDIRHSLGFLHDPRRFNVAVTRAMSLLIVIGSPWILRSDGNWLALIQYAKASGTYSGVKIKDHFPAN